MFSDVLLTSIDVTLLLSKVAVLVELVEGEVAPGKVETPVLQLFSPPGVVTHSPSVGLAFHVALAPCAGPHSKTAARRAFAVIPLARPKEGIAIDFI